MVRSQACHGFTDLGIRAVMNFYAVKMVITALVSQSVKTMTCPPPDHVKPHSSVHGLLFKNIYLFKCLTISETLGCHLSS